MTHDSHTVQITFVVLTDFWAHIPKVHITCNYTCDSFMHISSLQENRNTNSCKARLKTLLPLCTYTRHCYEARYREEFWSTITCIFNRSWTVKKCVYAKEERTLVKKYVYVKEREHW